MLYLLIVLALFGIFYYVEAFKTGLSAKKWALVGLLLGPVAFPLFSITQHIKLRHAQGFQNWFFKA